MRLNLLCTFLLLSLDLTGADIVSPAEFNVTATSSSTLLLTWKFSEADQGSIFSYRIQYKKSSDTEFFWVILDSSAEKYTISQLDANTTYDVSLQALGLLEDGEVINKSISTCPGVPNTVSQISLLEVTEDSVNLTWKNPTEYFGKPNSTLLEYWTPGKQSKTFTVDASATSHKLTGLNATLPYYVNVAARTESDSNGCGGGTGVRILGGLFYTISEVEFPPVGGTLTVTGPFSLRRDWNAPNTSDPRIMALTYLVTGGTRGPRAGILPMTARSLSINNLEPNTAYTVDIIIGSVYTRSGSPLTATTAPGVPGAPTDLTVTKQNNNALKVHWSAPTNPPGDIDHYVCSLYSGDLLVKTENPETTEHTFSGLPAERVYRVTVAASVRPNDEGLGGGSGPAAESDPIFMPDPSKPQLRPPTLLAVEAAGIDALTVKWDPPTLNTAGVYGYNIYFTDSDRQTISRFAPSQLTLYIMTGLKSGELYKVTMKSIGLLQDSEISEAMEASTLAGPPSPPQNVRATIVLPNTAEVTWSAPAQSINPVTGYVVEALQGGTILGTQKVPNDTLKAAFVLPSYAEVKFLVAAESSSGVSASTSSNVVFTKDFPFLEDEEMTEWISNTRFMIILRGTPGAGKEAVAQSIRSRFPSAKFCSDGVAPNRRVRRGAAGRAACLNNAVTFAKAGYSPIVIDSLIENADEWQGNPYVNLSMKNDYNVLLVVAQTPGTTAPEVRTLLHSEKNSLSVDLEKKRPSLAPVYPLYYGWFWPPRRSCGDKGCSQIQDLWDVNPSSVTRDLINISRVAFETILANDSLRATLAKTCGLSDGSTVDEVADFWKSAVNPLFGKAPPDNDGYPEPTRPHATSYYSDFGRQPGAKEYADLLIVNKALLGRLDNISVLGLMVSKRTIGARLKLADDMLPFWRQNDSDVVNGSLGGDRPSRPVGSRAHATLALAHGVKAVETGFDTMRVVDAEAQNYPNTEKILVSDGIIYDIKMPSTKSDETSEHIFYYEFSQPHSHRVIFTSFY
ncbi:hypothetical protein AAHC03_021001 [Spirometra sp. Aus1]